MRPSHGPDADEPLTLKADDILGFIAHADELQDSRRAVSYEQRVLDRIVRVLALQERIADSSGVHSFAEFAAALPDIPVRFGADRVRHAISFRDIVTLFKRPTTTPPWKAYAAARETAEAETGDVPYFAFVFELPGVSKFMAVHDYPKRVESDATFASWVLGSGRFRRRYTLEALDDLLLELR